MLLWLSRCLPGLSIIALILMLVFAFSDLLKSSLWKSFFPPSTKPPSESPWSGLSIPQIFFVVYIVFIHTQMFAFTIRLGLSLFNITKQTRRAINRRQLENDPDSPFTTESRDPFDQSLSKSLHTTEIEVGTPELINAIILPNYCEDLHTLETTLKVLASHPRAKSQYDVRFSMLHIFFQGLT
jgi:hypothetical protein